MYNLPLNEGFHGAVILPDCAPLEARMLKLGKRTSLMDLSKDFTFFSHAVLTLLPAEFRIDPVREFFELNNIKERPYLIEAPSSWDFFYGLGPLDAILFAVPNQLWPSLAQYLGTIGISHRASKTYFATELQKLKMIDFLYFNTHFCVPEARKDKPIVDVWMLALDGNKTFLYFRQSNYSENLAITSSPYLLMRMRTYRPITLVTANPRAETIKFADQLFSDQTPTLERWKPDDAGTQPSDYRR